MHTNHTLKNAFSSNLDLSKSKPFPSPPTMMWTQVAINEFFVLQSPYPCCHSIGKLRKPYIYIYIYIYIHTFYAFIIKSHRMIL